MQITTNPEKLYRTLYHNLGCSQEEGRPIFLDLRYNI